MSEKKYIASDGSEIKPGMTVLGRDNYRWTVDIFSHIESDCPHEFICSGGSVYTKCIPFEGNEHMAGTKLPIPRKENPHKEKPFMWGEMVLVWDYDCDEKRFAFFVEDMGENKQIRYRVILENDTDITSWENCTRAPLDATDD